LYQGAAVAGLVIVKVGALLARTKRERGRRGDIAAASVAWKRRVWLPSALPLVAKVVLYVKPPFALTVIGAYAPLSTLTARLATPDRVSVACP